MKPQLNGGVAAGIVVLVLVIIGIAAWKMLSPGGSGARQAAPANIPTTEMMRGQHTDTLTPSNGTSPSNIPTPESMKARYGAGRTQ